MRGAALFAIVLASAMGGAAAAQPSTTPAAAQAGALNESLFVAPGAAVVAEDAYAVGQGPVQWRSGELRLGPVADGGPVDSLRVQVGGVLVTPGGLPLNLDRGRFDARNLDVTLMRRWPGAFRYDSDVFALDLEPHAGLGVSSFGGQAEGGATLTLSRDDRAVARLRELGVGDGRRFGDEGRWYLFAAASGRAVGLNVLHGDNGWSRAGWTTDATGALVGDAQVGVGWRKGAMQTSFGVIHRAVRGQYMVFGQQVQDDTLAAFSFSIRPGR